MQKPSNNLVPLIGRLDKKERLTLLYMLNNAGGTSTDLVHLGSLPFYSRQAASRALNFYHYDDRYQRVAKKILSKLPELVVESNGVATFTMQLNNAKVFKHFGSHPERGKPLSFLPKEKVSVGRQWSQFKKAYVDRKDTLVSPCVTLKRVGFANKDNWEVTVKRDCRYAVECWLLEQCA